MKYLAHLKLFFVVAVSAALILPVLAQDNQNAGSPEQKTTVEGLVRDIACPIQNHAATATKFNLQCALECAKKGSPLVIMTNSGDMYLPMSASMPDTDQRQRLVPFVGKYVRATGTVYTRNGTRTIVISEIKELKDVHLITDAH
ncbi:MAG: hypothetical protein WBD87_08495 [Candidatus Acidiferrales bacterium]